MDAKQLADWLRSIADDVERRGIDENDISAFSRVGYIDVTQESDPVRNFKATRDFFLAVAWRYLSD